MNNSKKAFVLGLCCLFSIQVFAQIKQPSTLSGLWVVCYETKLDTNFQCNKQGITYEFREDGTYTYKTSPSKESAELTGKYLLSQNKLVLDMDDTKSWKSNPFEQNIVWINSRLFYAVGKEGKEVVYTYYQRKD